MYLNTRYAIQAGQVAKNQSMPVRVVIGSENSPVTAESINRGRQKLIGNNDTRKLGVMTNPTVPDGDQLLAYGLRLEGGSPVEFRYEIEQDAGTDAFGTAVLRAKKQASKFKRGEF